MERPDFTRLYAREAPITPRMAWALWWTACVTARVVEEDPRRSDIGLPLVALAWIDDHDWAARMAGCYTMVRERLAVAAFPLARCTGEEMALHMILSVARASIETEAMPDAGEDLAGDVGTAAFVAARNRLFRDRDLLLLFDPMFDGIEDPASEMNRRFGIGPLLHPARWFDTFPGYADAGPLERLEMVTFEVEQGALHAAADLATRSGATGFRVFHVDDDARQWRARAEYRNVELIGEGPTPTDAADALAAQIIEGGRCACGELIVTTDVGGCRWRRDGARWLPGCGI